MQRYEPTLNVGHPIISIAKVGDKQVEIRTTSERLVLEVSKDTPMNPTSLAYIVDSLQRAVTHG